MSSIQEAIADWHAAPRPLRALTKDQLYRYQQADPSEDAAWAFTREVLARRGAFVSLTQTVKTAEDTLHRSWYRIQETKITLEKAQGRVDGFDDNASVALLAGARRAHELAKTAHAKAEQDLKDLKAKIEDATKSNDVMSEQEVQAYYARRYADEWNQVLQSWLDGSLMHAQNYGWVSFLSVSADDRRADTEAFDKATTLAMLTGEDQAPNFKSMNALWQVRVMPPLHQRREFLADQQEGGSVVVASLKPETKRAYWAWWRAYNTVTLKYQWKDDSGIAYDDRQFSPTELRTEERVDE